MRWVNLRKKRLPRFSEALAGVVYWVLYTDAALGRNAEGPALLFVGIHGLVGLLQGFVHAQVPGYLGQANAGAGIVQEAAVFQANLTLCCITQPRFQRLLHGGAAI